MYIRVYTGINTNAENIYQKLLTVILFRFRCLSL